MSDVTSLPRETGSDKSTSTCPVCGTELPNATTAYGSVVPGACSKCGEQSLSESEKALAKDAQERGYPLGDPSEDWKVDQLTAYADEQGVDLAGVGNKKADILKAINEADAPA